MFASLILAASLIGQTGGDPAPNLPLWRYDYVARDPAIEAAMIARCMDPNAGMMNRNGTTGLPFRTVMKPLGTPSGIYFIRMWPTSLFFP